MQILAGQREAIEQLPSTCRVDTIRDERKHHKISDIYEPE